MELMWKECDRRKRANSFLECSLILAKACQTWDAVLQSKTFYFIDEL